MCVCRTHNMNPKALATVSEHNMEPRVMDYTQSAIDSRDTSSKLWHCLKLPPYTKSPHETRTAPLIKAI